MDYTTIFSWPSNGNSSSTMSIYPFMPQGPGGTSTQPIHYHWAAKLSKYFEYKGNIYE